jgi:hypothetical protein
MRLHLLTLQLVADPFYQPEVPMQCQSLNPSLPEFSDLADGLSERPALPGQTAGKPFHFQANFAGIMAMYSDAPTVATYLDSHQDWFPDCAQPLAVESIGDTGYLLHLGRFGALGCEVEVKIALALEPSGTDGYRMYSIPLPESSRLPFPYQLNYQALLALREIAPAAQELPSCPQPPTITQVDWQMELKIAVQFPKFIQRLPVSLVQKTGNRLLSQIVGQVSPRLTERVQRDFHSRLELPPPPKKSASYWRVN